MLDLTTLVRAHFRAWVCSHQSPGWRAIGTRPNGAQVITRTVDSPEDALRALLRAA